MNKLPHILELVVKMPNGCWEFRRMINRREQRSRVKLDDGRRIAAARAVFIQYWGWDPGSLGVLHECDNGLCVNPYHLFTGTVMDNVMDKNAKGRQARGEKHGLSKLTEGAVRQIRARIRAGEVQERLAYEYGVTPGIVSKIKRRLLWSHVQ